jgi:hypothetical protein
MGKVATECVNVRHTYVEMGNIEKQLNTEISE